MRAFALAVAGATLFVSLPAAADTSPPPPVTVVVVPGGVPAAPPPPSYPPGAYPAPPPGAYPAPPPGGYYPPPGGYYPSPGYYAPPGPYYAPPGTYQPLPAMERRSVGAMAGGIVGISAGGIFLFSALFLATIGDTNCAFEGSSCDAHTPAVIGLTVAGIAGIAIGVPLLIYGVKKVPLGTASSGSTREAPLPAWAGAPAGQGWRWRF